jgi:N,N-dimethylformamidase
MPVLYARALNNEEVMARFAQKTAAPNYIQPPQTTSDLLGCWPLSEEKGAQVADISPNGRHGTIINHGTWMIGGPSFAGAGDANYDPVADPTRGHGLRLASDDLYDCGWDVSYSYPVPPDTMPGIYVGRIQAETSHYDVTFVVRPAAAALKKTILILCSTNTWLAYNQNPFGSVAHTHPPFPDDPRVPTYDLYHNHRENLSNEPHQPTYHVGVNMPWPSAEPYAIYYTPDYSHLTRAERATHQWLTDHGYVYDIATDFDLFRDPALLQGYQVVIINGHSEYWTAQAYQSVHRFWTTPGS